MTSATTPPAKEHHSPLMGAYDALVYNGTLQNDPAQRNILLALDDIRTQLTEEESTPLGFLEKLFTTSEGHEAATGLYIWGHVGRGKSMLMDLFYQHTKHKLKRRMHFHAFMQEVHSRIHQLRQQSAQNKDGADPVLVLAKQMSEETKLLCFDELQVHDVADATLLYRLFDELWKRGVTVVSTSNRPPESLYTGEVQKERFLNFIRIIKENMAIATLDSETDYRTTKEESTDKRYHFPLGKGADGYINNVIQRICTDPIPKRKILEVQGRRLAFSLYDNHIGRFSFAELCDKALGAADYLAITKHCDTILLTDIPLLSPEKRNEAKRFVTLVDVLYEGNITVYFVASADADRLYPEGHGAFEFKRTVSRLLEMQSENWGQ